MFNKILNQQTPFWLFAFSVLIGLTLPILIQDGMFMDAMLYTSVSHNLSLGIGTFWFPQFSLHNVAELPSFHEQPPLVFGIQAVFFRLFGDSMYVERFYTFLTMCITAVLINILWKEACGNDKGLKGVGWLPLIIWITVPACFWSYSNNMLENTMGIFTLSAVILICRSCRSDKSSVALWILTGIFIFLATLSKGIPGFFPIAIPFLHWFTFRKGAFSKIFLQTMVITLVPAIIYAVLFLIPESKESLSIYLFKRALLRINEVPNVTNRFYILGELFMQLLLQILFVMVVLFIAGFKKIKEHISEKGRQSLFFILSGLAASVPLILTLVQKGFYFIPALPLFAIGFSLLIAPIMLGWTVRISIQGKRYKMLLLLCSFLLLSVTTFALMQKGKVSRDREMLHDIYLIGPVVPKQTTVFVSGRMVWDNWHLQCYMIRYFNISLDADDKHDYCIVDRSIQSDLSADYKKVDLKTVQYDLYKR